MEYNDCWEGHFIQFPTLRGIIKNRLKFGQCSNLQYPLVRWDALVGDIYQVMFSVVCFEDDDDPLGELNGVVPPCMGRAVLALGNVH